MIPIVTEIWYSNVDQSDPEPTYWENRVHTWSVWKSGEIDFAFKKSQISTQMQPIAPSGDQFQSS